jgi:hypothetical protein
MTSLVQQGRPDKLIPMPRRRTNQALHTTMARLRGLSSPTGEWIASERVEPDARGTRPYHLTCTNGATQPQRLKHHQLVAGQGMCRSMHLEERHSVDAARQKIQNQGQQIFNSMCRVLKIVPSSETGRFNPETRSPVSSGASRT